jgi:hypothetical protein
MGREGRGQRRRKEEGEDGLRRGAARDSETQYAPPLASLDLTSRVNLVFLVWKGVLL